MAMMPKGKYKGYVNWPPQLKFFQDGIRITTTDTKYQMEN